MSITDMIKKSVLEGFQTDISAMDVGVALGITLLLAVYIFFAYRFLSKSQFYSKDFNKALAPLALITAAIVIAMQSNLVISLGMVGALSIVRFRTAIKSPIDLVFLFWAISVGIICGAGMYAVACIASAVITIILFLLDLVAAPKAPYLLVINSQNGCSEAAILDVLKSKAKKVVVKSRNITKNGTNYVIELRTAKEQELIDACNKLEGVDSVSLLLHDGELRY